VKSTDDIERILHEHKSELTSRFHVSKIGIFGSYVRNEPNEQSDLDVIVEFSEPIGLFEFIDLEDYIGKLVGIKIDLVSRKGLRPHIGKKILDEVVYI
jgi:predicted nucleotidyltransferase